MIRLPKEEKAGVYLTVIIHLAVLIMLLLAGLGASLKSEEDFVFDFSKIEEAEKMQAEIDRLQKEIAFKEEISRKLQEELSESEMPSVRNVVVDRGALKDDRGTDAEELYKEAERLQKELESGIETPNDELVELAPKIETDNSVTKKEEKEPVKYSGPSVISYSLKDRKASRLPIPAYRCMGAGRVTVIITVNPSGSVLSAKIDDEVSAKDGCLRDFAIKAARISKFSAKTDAAPRQEGSIEYEFIAQ